eukprot:3475790-Rhodomonas_salina.1
MPKRTVPTAGSGGAVQLRGVGTEAGAEAAVASAKPRLFTAEKPPRSGRCSIVVQEDALRHEHTVTISVTVQTRYTFCTKTATVVL